MIKEHWLLMQSEMVRALLKNRKLNTRRIGDRYRNWKKGDRIWIRETWAMSGLNRVEYKAFPADGKDFRTVTSWKPSIHMFKKFARIWLEMTADAHQERLQDITADGCIKEGVTPELIEELLIPLKLKCKTSLPYWIKGDNSGATYCKKCVKKHLKNKEDEDGGFDSVEDDSLVKCSDCSMVLESTLTPGGTEDELEHFSGHGIKDCEDAYYFQNILDNYDILRNEQKMQILKIGFIFLWDLINGHKKGFAWKDNPIITVIEFKELK